jgi:hypothetical protein
MGPARPPQVPGESGAIPIIFSRAELWEFELILRIINPQRGDLERGVHCKPPDEKSVEKKRPYYIKGLP